MPYKDPEKLKEFKKEQMRERRAAAKKAAATLSKPEKKKKAAPAPISTTLVKPETQIDRTKRRPEGLTSREMSPALLIPPPAEPLSAPRDDSDLSGYSEAEISQARDVVNKTMELIDRRGWAKWRCSHLNNDIIVVIKDAKFRDFPPGYPVYTLNEIEMTAGMSPGTLKIIHAAKVAGVQDALPGMFAEILPREKN